MANKSIKMVAALAAMAVVLGLLVASCGPTPTPEVVEKVVKETVVVEKEVEVTRIVEGTPETVVVTATPEPPAKSEMANTLVIASNEYPLTMDPARTSDNTIHRATLMLYDALLDHEYKSVDLIPWLAKDYEVSDDGLTFTFYLNEGVKFHDGTELTASDVVFSFERTRDHGMGMSRFLQALDYGEVIDDYTVALHLKEQYGPFLMAIPKVYIMNEAATKEIEASQDLDAYLLDHDLGSGPYTVTDFRADEYAVFEKFDDYWKGWTGEEPEKVMYRYILESATQHLMLEKGEIDIALDPMMDDLEPLEANPDIVLDVGQAMRIFGFHFRVTNPPLDDVRVRKALTLGFDSDSYIEAALGGYGQRATAYMSKYPYFDPSIWGDPPAYDPEAAKALLAEAGYPDGGFTLPVAYDASQDMKIRLVELLQANYGDLGITVEPRAADFPTFVEWLEDEDSDISIWTTTSSAIVPVPDTDLWEFYHPDSTWNLSRQSDPKLVALLEEGISTADEGERERIYKEIQQYLSEQYLAVIMVEMEYVTGLRDWVKGYYWYPSSHQTVWPRQISIEGKP